MKRPLVFLLVVSLSTIGAFTQTLSFGFGDAELDTSLNELNVSAKLDLGSFSAEVTLQWGTPAAQVNAALSQGLQPAEVYFAASLAKLSGKSLDLVISTYKKDKKAGWGAVAKSLGIKPGSKEFKMLKDKTKGSADKAKKKKK